MIEIEYWNLQSNLHPTVSIWLTNEDGIVVLASSDFNDRDWYSAARAPGLVTARCTIPGNFLATEGTFFVLAAVMVTWHNPDTVHAMERDVWSLFQVTDRSSGEGVRGPYAGHWPGVVRPMLPWAIRVEASEAVDQYLALAVADQTNVEERPVLESEARREPRFPSSARMRRPWLRRPFFSSSATAREPRSWTSAAALVDTPPV